MNHIGSSARVQTRSRSRAVRRRQPSLLSALNLTGGLRLLLGIPNSQLLALASSPSSLSSLSSWVSRHISPFRSLVSAVDLDDNILASIPTPALPLVVPLLTSIPPLHVHLLDPDLHPASFDLVVANPFPYSQAFFNQALADSFISPCFASSWAPTPPLMVNLYPYYSLAASRRVVPLDSTLFRPLASTKEMVDISD